MVRSVKKHVKRGADAVRADGTLLLEFSARRDRGKVFSAMDNDKWMRQALEQADRAARMGEIPVGAVVVRQGEIIGEGHNRRETDNDPLAHAELLAIRQAARAVGNWRLVGCTIYVTLEPCAMCAGALVNSRVEHLVFGTRDPKAGFCGSLGDLVTDQRLNHRLEVTEGVLAEDCARLLQEFFATLRSQRLVL
jgi:tRNA(adenine34) deaminase